jgi:predicted DsbA family dithiol-disulfide isomerase
MRIDVVFDTVCPWCYIGKHRLQRALAQRPGLRADLRWRPFMLNPDMPEDGLDRNVYLERKFGSSYRIQRIHSAAVTAGKQEGIEFDFDGMTRMPSSIKSHRLIQWAGTSDRQEPLVEAIYQAFFLKGQDIGQTPVLAAIAESVGLAGDAAAAFLDSNAGTSAVETEFAHIHRLGVSGVPCFILDEAYAVSGAQEPDILARLLDVARETEVETASR